jgi:CheY-like chemotaxis protein
MGDAVSSVPALEPSVRDLLVLVVEDEVLLALDHKLLLEQHGWRVLGPVATVIEALRLLESERPDVALLDVNVNGEMVTPVAEVLRSLNLPFVLASAYDGPDLGALGLAGAPNVGKPTSERRLLAALARAVGR